MNVLVNKKTGLVLAFSQFPLLDGQEENEEFKVYQVEEIPTFQVGEHEELFIYYDGVQFTHEVKPKRLTPEEELRQRIELMQQTLDELLLGGM